MDPIVLNRSNVAQFDEATQAPYRIGIGRGTWVNYLVLGAMLLAAGGATYFFGPGWGFSSGVSIGIAAVAGACGLGAVLYVVFASRRVLYVELAPDQLRLFNNGREEVIEWVKVTELRIGHMTAFLPGSRFGGVKEAIMSGTKAVVGMERFPVNEVLVKDVEANSILLNYNDLDLALRDISELIRRKVRASQGKDPQIQRYETKL